MGGPDEERTVDLFEDELEILPDVTSDERDIGWSGAVGGEDEADRYERPPHW